MTYLTKITISKDTSLKEEKNYSSTESGFQVSVKSSYGKMNKRHLFSYGGLTSLVHKQGNMFSLIGHLGGD